MQQYGLAQQQPEERKQIQVQEKIVTVYEHNDDECPNNDKIKKLKAEIKRLRQDLIMKPAQKDNLDDLDQEFSEA